MTKHSERLRWWSDGRRRTSSTSTTSSQLTSSMKRLTDNDIVMRARSSWEVSIQILKHYHRGNDKIINHQQMLLSAFNETKAKVYLNFLYIWGQDSKSHWILQSDNTWSGWVSISSIFIFDMEKKLNMVEPSTLERFSTVVRVSGEQKNGNIKSGGTNGKNGQRQVHVQTSSGELVAGEYCFNTCRSRPEF